MTAKDGVIACGHNEFRLVFTDDGWLSQAGWVCRCDPEGIANGMDFETCRGCGIAKRCIVPESLSKFIEERGEADQARLREMEVDSDGPLDIERLTIAKRLWSAFWGFDGAENLVERDWNQPSVHRLHESFLAMADECILVAQDHAVGVLRDLVTEQRQMVSNTKGE